MDTAIVKLDSLADPVRTSAQNHDFWLVGTDGIFILSIIGGIIIGAVRSSAYMNAFPVFFYADFHPAPTDLILRDFQDLA